ncbi:hypothetical protein BH20PSE1_BH20PSE1_04490 [soil metagenome]
MTVKHYANVYKPLMRTAPALSPEVTHDNLIESVAERILKRFGLEGGPAAHRPRPTPVPLEALVG